MEKYELLKQSINNIVTSIIDEINILTLQIDKYNKLTLAYNEYQKGNFSIELFMGLIAEEELLYYQTLHNTYINLSNNKSKIFESQKEICQKKLDEFAQKIENELAKNKTIQMTNTLKTLKEKLVTIKEVNDKIENAQLLEIINNEDFELIISIMHKENISQLEQLKIVYEIAKENTHIIKKQSLELETNNYPSSKVEKMERDSKTLELYHKLLNIILNNPYDKNNLETINKFLSKLNFETSIEERINIYESIHNLNNRKLLILEDIKTNIIKHMDNNLELTNQDKEKIEKIIKIYQELNQKLSTNIYDNMQLNNMHDEEALIKKTEELISSLHNYLAMNYNNSSIVLEDYNQLYALYEQLLASLEEFKTSLELYFEEKHPYLKDYYENLLKLYNKTNTQFENTKNNNTDSHIIDEFYGEQKDIKNIIAFLPNNHSDNSLIADDIMDNKELKNINMNTLLRILQSRSKLSIQERNEQADHKVHTSNFSKSFLTKYHVKSAKVGNIRVLYTLFNTNIANYVGEYNENPYIMFVLALSAGNEKAKEKNFELALKRCYTASSEIDEIRNLLNPDWEKLSPNEKEEQIQMINNYLENQNKKLEKIIKIIDGKNKGGRKRG